MPLHIGDILIDRFRIVSRLGQGGFGAVYRAWDLRLNGPCAIKENLDISPAGQKQFVREASLLFNLRHPNLPRVFDTFFVEGQGQYLVMDFIEGEDLQSLLDRKGGPLPVEQALVWTLQVCDALIYLHSQQPPVIHRDIKPANIRITPAGQAALVDFGIAKMYDPRLKTTLGAQAVTPGYSPPEQYGSGSTDERSDIYSLGATVYTLLTGKVPPASVDIYAGLASTPEPARQLNPLIPMQVSSVLERAMQPNRTARLKAAAEFKAALSSAMADKSAATLISQRAALQQETAVVTPPAPSQPPRARPVSAPPAEQPSRPVVSAPASPPVRRRKWLFWATGLLAVFALVVIVGGAAAAWYLGYFPDVGPQASEPEIEAPAELALSGEFTLMHSYAPGGAEEQALIRTAEFAQQQFPELHVEIRSIPVEDVWQTYPQMISAGEGPDLLLAPNDHLGTWARTGLVLRLDEFVGGKLDGFLETSIEGMRVDDGIYGMPFAARTLALYFNREMIDMPPEITEDLLEMVRDGVPMVNVVDSYHLYGWGAAFGGELFDDQGRCMADQGGWIEALLFLRDLRSVGAVFSPEYEAMDDAFRRGEAALFVNGPWALGDYWHELGDSLGVATMPHGPAGPARPFAGFDGLYVNPNSRNVAGAVNLALFLSSRVVAGRFTEIAGYIPARRDVTPGDRMQNVFVEVLQMSFPLMQAPELENYWEPFTEMFVRVLLEDAPPEQALTEACSRMNRANER
ncbi:MAG: extracellular solute-binding protein [Anaerolineales bacterium]|nr:extracellular solute-binding protein [Anaerolineales bacterium]